MNDRIEYDWPDVGKMGIRFNGNAADISFYPAETVFKGVLHKAAKKPLRAIFFGWIKSLTKGRKHHITINPQLPR